MKGPAGRRGCLPTRGSSAPYLSQPPNEMTGQIENGPFQPIPRHISSLQPSSGTGTGVHWFTTAPNHRNPSRISGFGLLPAVPPHNGRMPRNLLFNLTRPTLQMASQSPSFEPTCGISFVVDYDARTALRHHYQRLKARYNPGITAIPPPPPGACPTPINIESEAAIAIGGTRPIGHTLTRTQHETEAGLAGRT